MPEIEADNLEIEKFLLEKLQSSICKNRPYSSMFKKMKTSLEKQLKIATDMKDKLKIREKLFLLNNLINEIDSNFAYLSWSRFRSLNQLHKEIKSAEIKPAASAANATPAARCEKSTREMSTKRALGLNADELAFRNLILYQTATRRKDFNAIGIVGAEGVGKTTLAQSIFAQAEVKQQFLPRIWISLSPDLTDNDEILEIVIAKRILLSLGISDETINSITQFAASTSKLAALIHAIRLELIGKRYLVVLDNASRMEDWYKDLRLEMAPAKKMEEKLAFAFPKGCGGTVLVVGWPEKVVEAMVGGDGSGIHRLLPLEDPKLCLEIYKEAAGGIEDDIKVEDEVVKRSNRLPKAAWLMGMIAKRNQETATIANQAVE